MNPAPISAYSEHDLFQAIDDGSGFQICQLDPSELLLIRQLVFEQYLHVIQGVAPKRTEDFYQHSMAEYHVLYNSEDFSHQHVWRKENRILGPRAVALIKKTQFWHQLKRYFGDFIISDEEQFGWGNIYWRLVRPGSSDIGPVHADEWFWELGHGSMPQGYKRYKLWLALEVVSGASGLMVVPGSQSKTDWKYHGEMKAGILKPVIDENIEHLDLINLTMNPGEYVIFHDRLLHGGMLNNSNKTRVSIEFTILTPEKHR